jgi:hypothetical protein
LPALLRPLRALRQVRAAETRATGPENIAKLRSMAGQFGGGGAAGEEDVPEVDTFE